MEDGVRQTSVRDRWALRVALSSRHVRREPLPARASRGSLSGGEGWASRAALSVWSAQHSLAEPRSRQSLEADRERWAARVSSSGFLGQPSSHRLAVPRSNAPPHKVAWIVRRWRPVLLCVFTIVGIALGWHYKSNASPGVTGNVLEKPPELLDVFVNDPGISIRLTNLVVNNVPFGSNESIVSIRLFLPATIREASVFIISSSRAPLLNRLHLLPINTRSTCCRPSNKRAYQLSPEFTGLACRRVGELLPWKFTNLRLGPSSMRRKTRHSDGYRRWAFRIFPICTYHMRPRFWPSGILTL